MASNYVVGNYLRPLIPVAKCWSSFQTMLTKAAESKISPQEDLFTLWIAVFVRNKLPYFWLYQLNQKMLHMSSIQYSVRLHCSMQHWTSLFLFYAFLLPHYYFLTLCPQFLNWSLLSQIHESTSWAWDKRLILFQWGESSKISKKSCYTFMFLKTWL